MVVGRIHHALSLHVLQMAYILQWNAVNAGLFFFHIFHDKFLAGQNFTIFEHGNYSMEFGKRL